MNIDKIFSFIEGNIEQPLWGNWYIKEKIGSGAFSAVYRVEAKRLNRIDQAALKIEPITAGDTLIFDEKRKRDCIEKKKKLAENESTIMYRLKRCPYIVAYEDEDIKELTIDGKFEGYCFLIRMELLTCISDLIYEKKMDFSESNIIKLAKHIGQGIKAAHDIGIIHRDIKPANFFVSHDGMYRLGDFNVSKLSDTARTFAGTNGYLAPEVYRAKSDVNESYTGQADIYAFGICLYQFMNDLYFPFEESCTADEAIDRRLAGEKLPNPRNASDAFSHIILKACAFNTANRYQTMDEMLSDLKKIKPTAKPVVNTAVFAGASDDRTVYADTNFRPDVIQTNVTQQKQCQGKAPNVSKQEGNRRGVDEYITSISAGFKHTVALRRNGTVAAVGDNNFGQCNVEKWQNITAVLAGDCHTVGLKSDGTVVAVGSNRCGECEKIKGWSNITSIAVGFNRTVGLRKNGTVVTVGDNSYGQSKAESWHDIVAISAGADHIVGLKSDGSVVAVGCNRNGECDVQNWRGITAVSARAYYTVGLKSNGTVVAVGLSPSIKSEIEKWKNIIAISAGVHHTVGLKSDGTVIAVGYDGNGECRVEKWKDIAAVSAGSWHTVGLKSNGTVVTVGSNRHGQCNCKQWNRSEAKAR